MWFAFEARVRRVDEVHAGEVVGEPALAALAGSFICMVRRSNAAFSSAMRLKILALKVVSSVASSLQ